jgi:hypothetical protein
MVRGTNYAFLCCVLSGTWYDWDCIFLECLKGCESLSLLLTATLSWKILYIMTRRASLRRTSRLRHLRCCSMSPTLDVLPCLLVTSCSPLCRPTRPYLKCSAYPNYFTSFSQQAQSKLGHLHVQYILCKSFFKIPKIPGHPT